VEKKKKKRKKKKKKQGPDVFECRRRTLLLYIGEKQISRSLFCSPPPPPSQQTAAAAVHVPECVCVPERQTVAIIKNSRHLARARVAAHFLKLDFF
jgi:hypothetical protein